MSEMRVKVVSATANLSDCTVTGGFSMTTCACVEFEHGATGMLCMCLLSGVCAAYVTQAGSEVDIDRCHILTWYRRGIAVSAGAQIKATNCSTSGKGTGYSVENGASMELVACSSMGSHVGCDVHTGAKLTAQRVCSRKH